MNVAVANDIAVDERRPRVAAEGERGEVVDAGATDATVTLLRECRENGRARFERQMEEAWGWGGGEEEKTRRNRIR